MRSIRQMETLACDLRLDFRQTEGRSMQESFQKFYSIISECVESCLSMQDKIRKVERVMELSVDQQYIREQLKEQGLVAFVADKAVLPRESGVSAKPMKGAVPFASPESMKVTMDLPYAGKITGMGIKKESP